MQPLLLLSAMPEESARIHRQLPKEGRTETEILGRKVYEYKMENRSYLFSTTAMGKVSAAAHTTALIQAFSPRGVLFFGLAGGIDRSFQHRGDLVIADSLFQYDLDCSPIPPFRKYEVPELKEVLLSPDRTLSEALFQAAQFTMGYDENHVYRGEIATGDRFVTDGEWVKRLALERPRLRAMEMEGAAVAQSCILTRTPFAVIRAISDFSDSSSAEEFGASLLDLPCDHLANTILKLTEQAV